jgi:Xaa-Pro dipeptidase
MQHRDDLAFPMDEYLRRLRELRERMAERGFDALLITTPENICYLTGFESPGYYAFEAFLVPLEGECIMIPRRLEEAGVKARTWVTHIRPYDDNEDPIAKVVGVLGLASLTDKRIGFERDCWFFTATQQERLFAKSPVTSFVDCSGIVEAGRLVKSELEIDMMRKAARFAEAGMRAGIEAIRDGATENDVAAAIHFGMISAGGEWPAISPFVAAGHRGSIGHTTWEGVKIEKGQCVFMEVGGCFKRYHAALMRTAFVGKPDQRIELAAKTIEDAMQAALTQIEPGMRIGEVDAISRTIIRKASDRFGGIQMTRSGYSIGIAFPPDWGEGHIMSIRHEDPRVLVPNMTFHHIPWVQLPGKAGIGMSETIRVTEDGCETLTKFDRELFVVEA